MQIHNLWVLPLQFAVAVFVLYRVVGISCFGGFFVMACIFYVSFIVSKLHRVYLAMIMKFKDQRLGIISELLNNIKIIKLQVLTVFCLHLSMNVQMYNPTSLVS